MTGFMEMDSSVDLSTLKEINAKSTLAPEEFADKVLADIPSDIRSANVGYGRILLDFSILMQTRYVLCDIHEEGKDEDGTYKYRIEIKTGKKTSRIGDAVFCVLFILGFWFAGKWFTMDFSPLFLVLTGLIVAAALYLLWSLSRSKFGPEQAEMIAQTLSCRTAEK